ncbi:MAG: MBOAT family protein [Chloroflexi bacterium]|nr:MBOAT family protein [Chloroflexota bacterium]
MSFISTEFIVFATIVVVVFFCTTQRLRWLLLLLSSYYFYAFWNPSYLLLIIFSTLVDYFVALGLSRSDVERRPRRRLLLALSVLANIGVLFVFKYANLFAQTTAEISAALGAPIQFQALDVLLPVGISFYTFQSMSYTFDVYRGRLRAERNLGIFATYVAFFPQLVAGPIERAANMLPQFRLERRFCHDRVVSGLRLVLWGAFKKIVVADRLAIYVNEVYGDLERHTGLSLIFATVFFAFQIYCDFSGYSDIAIGVARVLGFKLMENFRRPYLARSLGDFWRRWHISLSTWFRDYVYISLGGNRRGLRRQILNSLVVFAISGLWHGANWTFVIWGLYHGLLVALQTMLGAAWPKAGPNGLVSAVSRVLVTFMLVTFGWIFFRASSLWEIEYVLRHLFDFSQGVAGLTLPFAAGLLLPRAEFALSILLIAFIVATDVLDERVGLMAFLSRLSLAPRWTIYYVLTAGIYGSLFYSAAIQEFFYFQF